MSFLIELFNFLKVRKFGYTNYINTSNLWWFNSFNSRIVITTYLYGILEGKFLVYQLFFMIVQLP